MKINFLLIIVLLSFSACQINKSQKPVKQEPDISDMSAAFTSISSLGPLDDKDALLKIVNNSAMQIARTEEMILLL